MSINGIHSATNRNKVAFTPNQRTAVQSEGTNDVAQQQKHAGVQILQKPMVANMTMKGILLKKSSVIVKCCMMSIVWVMISISTSLCFTVNDKTSATIESTCETYALCKHGSKIVFGFVPIHDKIKQVFTPVLDLHKIFF